MSRAIKAVLVMLTLLLVAQTARAHEMTASVTLDPPVPAPGGKGALQVRLVDPYGAGLPGAQVRGSVGPMNEPAPAPVPLPETSTGVYLSEVKFPSQPAAVIRLEVILPDDRWTGMLPIRVGADWFEVKELPVELKQAPGGGTRTTAPPSSPTPAPSPPSTSSGAWKWFAGLALGALLLILAATKYRS